MKARYFVMAIFAICFSFILNTYALEDDGKTIEPFSRRGLYELNIEASKLYNTIIYGKPHGDFMKSETGRATNEKGESGEYRFLGYNYDEKKITNDYYFINSNLLGTIFDQNYTNVKWNDVDGAFDTWRNLPPELYEYMLNTNFYDADHVTAGVTDTGFNLLKLFNNDIDAIHNKAKILTYPTDGGYGTVYLEYGLNHWNTVRIPSIPSILNIMTAQADKYAIPAGEKEDITITIDTSQSYYTNAGVSFDNFSKREYWAGIGDVAESQKEESLDGIYVFTVKDVPPDTLITVWSKLYSDELKELGYEYTAEAIKTIYIGERYPPKPGEYDLDYNILSRKVKYPLSDTGITATLKLPRGSWNGSAWGSLNVTNDSPGLLENFSVANNPPVSEKSSVIIRNPEINITFYRENFGDDPKNKVWIDVPNPLIPKSKTGSVSYEGKVYREYKYRYSCSGCKALPASEGEEVKYTCPGHTGYGTASADFDSGKNTKTLRAFIYNGKPVIPAKKYDNKISNNSIYSERKVMYWESEPYELDVIRWMYHMDENDNLYNPTRVDGRYKRIFTQQCSAEIQWYTVSSMEQNYERSRKAALNRDYRKSESDKAVFASDVDFKYVDYPIKSGYYFNPCGVYEFIVTTVTYKTVDEDTVEHKELVDAVIDSFRYETDLMYINSDKDAVNIQNEFLPYARNSYERRPASLTAQNPRGVDDKVLLEVYDRSTNPSRYSKIVEELYHSENPSGSTHKYLKEIMEGYTESGTESSNVLYKYREYIKEGQKIYKITEKTRVTIRINPDNMSVYTHAHMPDGKYYVKAWIDDINLAYIGRGYNDLGVLKGISSLDEIEVTVKGSLYDDVNW